jgi:hypothetical protein
MSREMYNYKRKAIRIAKRFSLYNGNYRSNSQCKNGKRNYTDFKNSKIDTGGIKGNGAV